LLIIAVQVIIFILNIFQFGEMKDAGDWFEMEWGFLGDF
jgi:hypothetical protein